MTELAVVARACAAFSHEASTPPSITLRGGNDLDDYQQPSAFDPALDAISEGYLEQYAWGLSYLDPESWRHYLPSFIAHAVQHLSRGSNAVDALLNSLRPPDREAPRLASLSAEQESVIVEFLDLLAFSPESVHQDLASQALEEWWAPGALYRTPGQ